MASPQEKGVQSTKTGRLVKSPRRIRVVVLVRKSDWQQHTIEHWHTHLQPIAKGLMGVWHSAYHMQDHDQSECLCSIEYRQITLVGVSSNENMATFKNHQVEALRNALRADHEVYLLTTNHDGAFTNVHGYLQFLSELNSTCAFNHMIWWSNFHHSMYTRSQIIQVITPENHIHDQCLLDLQAIFSISTKVALNKTVISLALAQNRRLMGTQRNRQKPVSNTAGAQTVLEKRQLAPVKLGWDEVSKKKRKTDGHERQRRDYCPLTELSDGFECPYCQSKFPDRESVIIHLVNMGRQSKQCPLCPATKEVESKKQPYWRKHIKGHVDERENCGIDGCNFTPTNKNRMRVHREICHASIPAIKMEHYCDQCDAVLSSRNALSVHKKWHDNPQVNCNHCKMLLPFRDLKGHKMRECPSLPDRIAVCTECYHEMSPHHVARHMRTSHERVHEVMEFAREHYPEYLEGFEDMIGMLQT